MTATAHRIPVDPVGDRSSTSHSSSREARPWNRTRPATGRTDGQSDRCEGRKEKTMKSNRTLRIVAAVVVASLLAVAASVSSAAPTKSQKTVTIKVTSLIPGSTSAAFTMWNTRAKQFMKKNPNIKVVGVPFEWKQSTFGAQLAAGTLPYVIPVPFTDARTLGANKQIADLTALAKKLTYFKKFNPPVIAEGMVGKKVVAIPTAAYAQALHYNRTLFKQAGLNPNKPPTTWDGIRKAAKQIAAKTGKPGYVEMAASGGTGGWILTTVVYALGGRLETGHGTKAKATIAGNKYVINALHRLKTMRWTDNSMGSNFNHDWGTINQAFAGGQVGMYISGSDVYTSLVQGSNMPASIYGIAPIPTASNKTAVNMGGGTMVAVPKRNMNAAKLAACMKWINFFYEQPLVTKAAAIVNAKALVADKQPVGVPTFPVFNKKQFDLANSWIKPYFNVPRSQMKPFLTGIFKKKLAPEPAWSTQSVYASLSPVVQAVLTDKNANITSLLQTAQKAAQTAINHPPVS